MTGTSGCTHGVSDTGTTRSALYLLFAFIATLHSSARADALSATTPQLPTDPLLAQLIEESLAARPELAQAQATVTAERERAPQVGSLPDPMLQVGVQNDTFTTWNVGKMETSWYSIMATETFPWPGKLGLRRDAADLSAAQAAQNVVRVRLTTEADVRRAYLALILALDRLGLIERLEALSQRTAASARARYEAAAAAQSDILRAHLELKRLRQRRWALQVEADTAMQTLNRLRAHALDEAIRPRIHTVEFPVPDLRPEPDTIQDALDRSPELAAARAGIAQGERLRSLAHKSYLPDFTISFGVMPRGGEFPPMWLASLGVPIPVFAGSKQSRAVAESEARVAAAQRNFDALEQLVRLRAQQRRTALRATLETIRIYREGLLAESDATVESTLAQYETGKVTFISVLEANAGFINDHDGYLLELAQAQRLEIDAAEVSLAAVDTSGPAMPSGAGGSIQATASSASGGMSAAPPAAAGGSSGSGM